MQENENRIVTYIRGDISVLSEQNEEREAMAFLNRIRGELGMASFLKLIDGSMAEVLGEELGEARQQADRNIKQLG